MPRTETNETDETSTGQRQVSIWLAVAAMPILFFFAQFVFDKYTATTDETEREVWMLKGKVDVLQKDLDETKVRGQETNLRIHTMADGHDKSTNRLTILESGADRLGTDIKRETDRLNSKVDRIENQVGAIYQAVISGAQSSAPAPRTPPR